MDHEHEKALQTLRETLRHKRQSLEVETRHIAELEMGLRERQTFAVQLQDYIDGLQHTIDALAKIEQ